MQNTQHIFKIVVVKIPRISVFRSFTYFYFLVGPSELSCGKLQLLVCINLSFLRLLKKDFS